MCFYNLGVECEEWLYQSVKSSCVLLPGPECCMGFVWQQPSDFTSQQSQQIPCGQEEKPGNN